MDKDTAMKNAEALNGQEQAGTVQLDEENLDQASGGLTAELFDLFKKSVEKIKNKPKPVEKKQ